MGSGLPGPTKPVILGSCLYFLMAGNPTHMACGPGRVWDVKFWGFGFSGFGCSAGGLESRDLRGGFQVLGLRFGVLPTFGTFQFYVIIEDNIPKPYIPLYSTL